MQRNTFKPGDLFEFVFTYSTNAHLTPYKNSSKDIWIKSGEIGIIIGEDPNNYSQSICLIHEHIGLISNNHMKKIEASTEYKDNEL